MHADRCDQQDGRSDRTRDRDEIDGAHGAVEQSEALLERQGQQKAGEQLNTGLRHSQLLQQARPIAVQPFGFRLVAIRIPALLRFRMLDIHERPFWQFSCDGDGAIGVSRRSAKA